MPCVCAPAAISMYGTVTVDPERCTISDDRMPGRRRVDAAHGGAAVCASAVRRLRKSRHANRFSIGERSR